MRESFKQFRKKHLSNDPVITFFPLGPCSKSSAVHEAVKHSLIRKGKEETKTTEQDRIPHVDPAVNPEEELVPTDHPVEPVEIDNPIRCPHPEPGIIQDGRIWKERLQLSIRRRGQLPFMTENEIQRLQGKRHMPSSDRLIFPCASAREPSVTNLLS